MGTNPSPGDRVDGLGDRFRKEESRNIVNDPLFKDAIPQATELEVFLPPDGSNLKDGMDGKKYKFTITPKGNEPDHFSKPQWDPFAERKVEHPTSDCDTLTHLLKASLGTGILAMPIAFMNSGLAVGVFATVLVAIICTHCSYILVKCAHELYSRTRVTAMTFADVGEVAFANGPSWGRGYAPTVRTTILASLFLTYFGTCSVYTVIIATNLQQVFVTYFPTYDVDVRVYLALLLVPLVLIGWVPNLKYLAPVSMIANLFMGIGLSITIYYLVTDIPSISERNQYGPIMQMPMFFSIVIFAMEAIGVVMPLENNMRNPRHFLGLCGVLNQGMAGVTLIYILVGFLGYLKYGDKTEASITLNLPMDEIAAQSVKVLIALAVYCTYGLQYYVCLEIAVNAVKEYPTKHRLLREYAIRTSLVVATVILAIAVPTIAPFIALIGALCFSILGLIVPALIEVVTFWEHGMGPGRWRLWKNILLCVFGLIALGSGTYTSILEIIAVYATPAPVYTNGNSTTESLGFDMTTITSVNSTFVNETLT
ncbi:Proton-coupled amino acid transporter-like protein pathetic [Gryllus bimaculatus]|nr:Proton-coupled amino acid transporter-like protein pathetic [Gryllus bimaculatus]